MASRLNETPSDTKTKVLMWSEFMWRIQASEPDFIRLDTKLGEVPVVGMSRHFPPSEQRSVSDLFTVGRPWLRHQMSDIAFGSLMHVIQDSFSGGHTFRRTRTVVGCARSEIVNFHTYAGQDKARHKVADGIERARDKGELVEVLRVLLNMREQRKEWTAVAAYLSDCVFKLADDASPASTDVSEP